MRNDNLPGLTPIAILSLSAVLAVLLSVGIPILLSPEPVKLSDWLGFAGAVVAAPVTLAAAIIAWRAVQAQITAQRVIADQQAAIQTYGVLHELATTIENEIRLALSLSAIADETTLIDKLREQAPIEIAIAGLLKTKLDETRGQLKAVRNEWAIADTKRWQFRAALDARMALEETIVELTGLIEVVYARLVLISNTDQWRADLVVDGRKYWTRLLF